MNDRYRLDRPAPGPAVDAVVLARTVRGGLKNATVMSCEVRADGSYTCRRIGRDDVVGRMTPDQLVLFEAVCHATDFAELPRFVDVPVTRSDSYLWTYRIGEQEVSLRDADRAADAVPAALHAFDALVTALESGLPSTGTSTGTSTGGAA